MSKFIELTGLMDGKVGLFNVDTVSHVQQHGNNSAVEFSGSNNLVGIKESYEEVKAMLLKRDVDVKKLGSEVKYERQALINQEKSSDAEIERLRQQNNRYRKALEFYADKITYTDKQYTSSGHLTETGYLNIMSDRGEVARRALEGSE